MNPNDLCVTAKDWIKEFCSPNWEAKTFVTHVLAPLSRKLLEEAVPDHQDGDFTREAGSRNVCYVGYQSALLGRRIHGHYYYRKGTELTIHRVDDYAHIGKFRQLLETFSLTEVLDWAIERRDPSSCYVFEFRRCEDSITCDLTDLSLSEPWLGVTVQKCQLTYKNENWSELPPDIVTLLEDWARRERRQNRIQDYLECLAKFFDYDSNLQHRVLTLIPLWIGHRNHTLAMGIVWFQTQQRLVDDQISKTLNLAVNWLAPIRIAEQNWLTLQHAARAARAAIMARNMSHNIGSHVTPRTTVDKVIARMEQFKENLRPSNRLGAIKVLKSRLDEYLRCKGDFIAEITSEPLTSTKVAWFYGEVVAPFVSNVLFMDNICRNEQLGYRCLTVNTLRIRVLVPSDTPDSGQAQAELKASYSCSNAGGVRYMYPDHYPYIGNCLYEPLFLECTQEALLCKERDHYPGEREAELQLVDVSPTDVEVALPGPLGEYALYGFLENLLRNAAKHNRDKVVGNGLVVTLAVCDQGDDPDFYEFAVWDNATDPNAEVIFEEKRVCLKQKISELLKRDVIQEDGRLRREAWGLAEMRICAALLGGDWRFGRLDEALRVESEQHDRQERLVFKLSLMKPKRIYALTASQVSVDLEAKGVIVKRSLQELTDDLAKRRSPASADFFLLDVFPAQEGSNSLPDEKDIKALLGHLHMLPFRLLCAIPEGDKLAEPLDKMERQRRLVVVREKPPWAESAKELERWAWRNWLRRWLKEGGQGQGCVVNVFLDQGKQEEPTQSWNRLAEKHNQSESKPPGVTLTVLHRSTAAQNASGTSGTRHVFYDRHGVAVGNQAINLDHHAYIWFDKLSPDFVRIFRRDPPALLPFQLAEAGLLRVLVIDERIADLAGRDPGLSREDRKKLGQILGLDANQATAWHLAYAARVLVCTSLSWDRELDHRKYTDRDLCKVTVKCGEITCECTVGNSARSYANQEIDACIIHQGILDDFKCGPTKALEVLQDLIPFVIVDSGRGIPPGLPPTQKFLPFSILDDWIGQRTGKLVLSQLLMQLTRRTDQFT